MSVEFEIWNREVLEHIRPLIDANGPRQVFSSIDVPPFSELKCEMMDYSKVEFDPVNTGAALYSNAAYLACDSKTVVPVDIISRQDPYVYPHAAEISLKGPLGCDSDGIKKIVQHFVEQEWEIMIKLLYYAGVNLHFHSLFEKTTPTYFCPKFVDSVLSSLKNPINDLVMKYVIINPLDEDLLKRTELYDSKLNQLGMSDIIMTNKIPRGSIVFLPEKEHVGVIKRTQPFECWPRFQTTTDAVWMESVYAILYGQNCKWFCDKTDEFDMFRLACVNNRMGIKLR